MSYNLLAVNVGNTRIQVGVFEEGQLQSNQSLATTASESERTRLLAGAFSQIKSHPNVRVMLASVNAPMSDPLERMLGELVKMPILRIEQDMNVPIGRQLDPETIVGDDRLLNAAAAYATLKQACIIVDAGTAITVDFVDGQGTFHGGAINAGAQLMLDCMHRHAWQLPQITLAKPQQNIGHNTTEAMRLGVFHGLRGMVRELVEHFARETGVYPLVIATGGDAPMLFENYELVDRIVPELTLLGMAKTLQAYLASDDAPRE